MSRRALFQDRIPHGGILLAAAMATLLAPVLSSCSSPAIAPREGNSGAIGITVEKRWAAGTGTAEMPEKVYFIRLREGTKLNKQKDLFPSNFRHGAQVYLLNAKPGRYVVVAASDSVALPGIPRGLDPLRVLDDYQVYTTYFDEALIRKTEVEVKPGEFIVAGNFMVSMKNTIYFGDKIQRYFHKVVHPTVTDPFGSPIIINDNSIASRATLGEDRSSKKWEMQFLQAAETQLAGSGWTQLVRKRMEALRRN